MNFCFFGTQSHTFWAVLWPKRIQKNSHSVWIPNLVTPKIKFWPNGLFALKHYNPTTIDLKNDRKWLGAEIVILLPYGNVPLRNYFPGPDIMPDSLGDTGKAFRCGNLAFRHWFCDGIINGCSYGFRCRKLYHKLARKESESRKQNQYSLSFLVES